MINATTTGTWATAPTSTRRIDLVGQVVPRQRLRDALHLAQDGRADRVLVTGPAGSGRSSVLDELAATSDHVTVLQARAVDAESSLAYSVLFDLCRPVLHLVDELPPMHRDLLRRALSLDGSTAAAAPPLAVGVSLLSLLAHASRVSPLLVIVDDIDRADAESFEAVAFAARRLAADAVAVAVAGAVGAAARLRSAGFDVVALEPLADADAAALLERVLVAAPAPSVREAILAVAQGNPLALTLLPRSLSLSQLRGRWPLPDPLPSPDHLVDIVARELAHLSTDAQGALVVAAASLTGSCTAIDAALMALGISTGAVAELVGHDVLVADGGQLRFRRPLLRTVAYARATTAERRRAHAALAEVIGGEHDLECRAKHRAAAASGPDAEAATLLEQSARALEQRGAQLAATAATDRSVMLTADASQRAARRVMAAERLLAIGDTERASVHLTAVPAETNDTEVLATSLRLRGRILVSQGSSAAGQQVLADGAQMARRHDPDLAAMMLSEAAVAALHSRRLEEAGALASEAACVPEASATTQHLAALVQAAVRVASGAAAQQAPMLGEQIAGINPALATGSAAQILDAVALALVWSERYDDALTLLDLLVDERRRAAALGLLPPALSTRALLRSRRGRPVHGYADAIEALRLIEADDRQGQKAASLAVLASIEAALGFEDQCLAHVAACLGALGNKGIGSTLRQAAVSSAGVLELSAGRPARAITWLAQLSVDRRGRTGGSPAIVLWEADLAEALAEEGRDDEAAAILDDLEERARVAANHRALGAAARCRGLLAGEAEMGDWFAASIAHYERPPHPLGAARTRLAWGRRVAKAGRHDEAITHLRGAAAVFDELCAGTWSERARSALGACGVAAVGGPPMRVLSPDAAEVAVLAACGFDVPKIADHVVASEQTVAQLLTEATVLLGTPPSIALAAAVAPAPSGRSAPPPDRLSHSPTVTVQVLGGFSVTGDDHDLTPPPGLAARVVKLLALSAGGGVNLDEVIDQLWPDLPSARGRARLRNILSRLRQTSGDLVERAGEALRLAPRVDVDLDRFDRLATAALVAAARDDSAAPSLARRALAAHRGPLLPDSPYEPWAAAPRERARRRLLELLDLLAADHRSQGRFDDAVRLMERTIELDEYDEARYIAAAEVRQEQGRMGAAVSLLRRARSVVAELGLPPSPRLLDLEHRLRR